HVYTELAGADDHERGGQVGAGHAGQSAEQVNRVVVDLVPPSGSGPDAVCAEGRASASEARRLVVPDVVHEVVLDDVVVATAHVDADGGPRVRGVVVNARDPVLLHCECGGIAKGAERDRLIRPGRAAGG